MFKRRTSRVRQRRQVRVLRASVISPRIFWFDFRRALWSFIKTAVVLGLIGFAGWGVWQGVQRGLLKNDEFKLRQIVLNENPAIDEIRLVQVAGIDLQGSLFDCDPSEIRKSLVSLPVVAGASVKRDFPGTLEVTVNIRRPFLWIASESQGIPARDQERGMLVDRSGRLFRCAPGMFETAARLPVIEIRGGDTPLEPGTIIDHPDYARGLRLYNIALEVDPDAVDWIDSIKQHKAWGSKLVTREALEATFGHEDLERQMGDLFSAMSHARAKGDRIKSIYLLGRRNQPVTFHERAIPRAVIVAEPEQEPAPATPAERDLNQLFDR